MCSRGTEELGQGYLGLFHTALAVYFSMASYSEYTSHVLILKEEGDNPSLPEALCVA